MFSPANCCIMQAIQSDPMLRQMVDANPQMRAMLSNPAMMRQVMDPNNLAVVLLEYTND